MIRISDTEVYGWETAIRGMRNPMNSWAKSDSGYGCAHCEECTFPIAHDPACDGYHIGKNDRELMEKLAAAGPVHGKFMRMITVTADIVAPLYFWKEFDTYKVGTVTNSCSTMHKIHAKEFVPEDFSCEHLMNLGPITTPFEPDENSFYAWKQVMDYILIALNGARTQYLTQMAQGHVEFAKELWWQMIQLLPSSYNQRRTVQMNYEVLRNIHEYRQNHKLDEWRELCKWIETLPYSELIVKHPDS